MTLIINQSLAKTHFTNQKTNQIFFFWETNIHTREKKRGFNTKAHHNFFVLEPFSPSLVCVSKKIKKKKEKKKEKEK